MNEKEKDVIIEEQKPDEQEHKKVHKPTKVGKFFHEFHTFAVKGNMMDMAIGMIVGGAFTLLVTSIVTHVATPLLGILIGVDFSEWTITLPHLYGNAEPGVLAIGNFLNAIISFFIVAFVVFLIVKAINAFHHAKASEPAPPPEPSAEETLLTEIRDLLKSQQETFKE